ncbi:hypothetical protein MTO96_000270 [Rhipicephalus appendiculatus]
MRKQSHELIADPYSPPSSFSLSSCFTCHAKVDYANRNDGIVGSNGRRQEEPEETVKEGGTAVSFSDTRYHVEGCQSSVASLTKRRTGAPPIQAAVSRRKRTCQDRGTLFLSATAAAAENRGVRNEMRLPRS